MGSIRPRNVRFGSAPETTARAAISSPLARTTALTLPSLTRTRATSASVRISAPAARAAAAMASESAPMPPATKVAGPAECGSKAAWSSRFAVVPLDQGPANIPWMPRPAIAARSSSVSNHSEAKSATAIGPQRSRRRASWRGSPRKPRPAFSRPKTSCAEGLSGAGGVEERTGCRKRPRFPRLSWNFAHRRPSFSLRPDSSEAVRFGSSWSRSARPSEEGAKTRTAGRRNPRPASPRSRTIFGSSGPAVCATGEHR